MLPRGGGVAQEVAAVARFYVIGKAVQVFVERGNLVAGCAKCQAKFPVGSIHAEPRRGIRVPYDACIRVDGGQLAEDLDVESCC